MVEGRLPHKQENMQTVVDSSGFKKVKLFREARSGNPTACSSSLSCAANYSSGQTRSGVLSKANSPNTSHTNLISNPRVKPDGLEQDAWDYLYKAMLYHMDDVGREAVTEFNC